MPYHARALIYPYDMTCGVEDVEGNEPDKRPAKTVGGRCIYSASSTKAGLFLASTFAELTHSSIVRNITENTYRIGCQSLSCSKIWSNPRLFV